MNFPWLHPYIKRLSESLQQDSAPHALMLSGGKGLGVDVLASHLALLALCSNPRPEGACMGCKSCKLFASESHTDFRALRPEETGKQIKVDNVRMLVEFVYGSSMQDGRKVAVIDPVEALNINGANALLKTLEEPAGDTLLILVAEREEAVLPTIRSRCQVVQVRKPGTEESLQWLREQSPESPEDDLHRYLKLSGGAPVAAWQYLQIGALELQEKMFLDLAAVLKNETVVSVVATKWCDELLLLRIEWMVHWMEQIIRCASLGTPDQIVHPHAIKMFTYLAERCKVEMLYTARQALLEELAAVKGVSNPNPQLLMESILMQWYGLMQMAKKSL